MSWYANQVYALPKPGVIAGFQTSSFLADQMYHVDDLRGVRDSWTREMLDSRGPVHEDQRHGLPEGGLLVVSPEIYKTPYDNDLPETDEFQRHFRHKTPWPNSPPSAKWAEVKSPEEIEVFFPPSLDRRRFPANLIEFLKWIYRQTSSPMVYYHCAMWGGDVEEEIAWIVESQECVYEFKSIVRMIKHTPDGSRTKSGDVLQTAMGHLGFRLPSRFFALHETTFDWKLYKMKTSA